MRTRLLLALALAAAAVLVWHAPAQTKKRSLVGVPWICCHQVEGKQVCASGLIEAEGKEPKR